LGDEPEKRIHSLGKIISSKPTIVVYGIGLRDFEKPFFSRSAIPISEIDQQDFEKPSIDNSSPRSFISNEKEHILPDVYESLNQLLQIDQFFYQNFNFTHSPKYTTFQLMKNINNAIIIQEVETTDPEFSKKFPFNKNREQLDEILKIDKIPIWRGLDIEDRNFLAFEKIINSLNSNNIKVIIFVTPVAKEYLEVIPEDDKNSFFSKLKTLEENYDLQFYNFLESYSELEIWFNTIHVTTSDEGLIYTRDIAGLI